LNSWPIQLIKVQVFDYVGPLQSNWTSKNLGLMPYFESFEFMELQDVLYFQVFDYVSNWVSTQLNELGLGLQHPKTT
jgi:hypothetical protein